MKFPFLQLFCGDYLSDPKLSLCSSSTRGVWMDFLCVMHMNDRCGVITGTREQLARLGRCSTVEVSIAIDELDRTKTADVTERNSVVTLVCRRMKRESDARKLSRLRVQKHRENADVTPGETQKPLLVIEYGSGSSALERECEGKPKPAEAPELIYAEYPKKAARPDALRAIVKAIKKIGFCELLAKTRAYALAVQGQDFQFVPYPASWFNAERYNDDPETWATQNKKQTSATETDHSKGF